jgi:ParB family chromosome partitioning protein
MEELGYTQEQVAERMGKDRSTVANFIRLLKLPPDIQLAVRNSELSMGHARALINVDTIDKQLFIFNEIKEKGLSVRQTEALVRNLYKQSGAGRIKKSLKSHLPSSLQRIEDKLASHFSTRVKLRHSRNGSGQIIIEYYSQEELNKILGHIDVSFD